MRFRKYPIRILPLIIAVIMSAMVPKSSDSLLLKIDAIQRPGFPPDLTNSFRVIQELQSCWIVESSMEDYRIFQRAGGSGSILHASPSGKSFYLLSPATRDQIRDTASIGHVVPVEDGIVLFWSENDSFHDQLPEQVRLKSLPSQTPLRITFPDSGQKRTSYEVDIPEPAAPIEAIADMVASVSVENLRSYIRDLQNFQTRRVSTSSCEAAGSYLYDFFTSQGLAAEYDPFTIPSSATSTRNVVATIPGKTIPERIILIGAHYDSTSNQAFTLAPGADDNASGTAAVMEIARLMREQPFDASVRFVCFSGEELGLYGSRHYAQSAVQADEQIEAMINLDMIGYTTKPSEDLEIITNAGSSWLADLFLEASGSYTGLPVLKLVLPSAVFSDHSPFWDQGYSAIMGIESEPVVNPYYHKTTDTLDTLNLEFTASATKAVLATAAVLAHPSAGGPLPPFDVAARAETVRSLFRRFKNVMLTWKSDDPAVAGYNIYRAGDMGSNYVRINIDPVQQPYFVDRYLRPDLVFYYVVTALDAQGHESAYSKTVVK
jgi:hypothetical protein